ncbi:hypothetical protein ACROYT_G023651 [Oculina patagonica]
MLIAFGFTFSCAYNDAQGLVKKNSGRMPSLFHHIKLPRKANIVNQIKIAREDKPLTKCEKLHNEALAKKEHGATTIYVPQCREDGSFEPKQCYGSIGYCWCVDKNGDEIPGTRTKFGHVPPLECLLITSNPVKKRTKPLTKCKKLRDEALEKEKNGGVTPYIPQCKEDGGFEPKQCSGSTGYCWCVDKNGDEIPGTQTPPGNQEPRCKEQDEALTKCEKLHNEALAKKEHGATTIYVPQCREDGSFEPKQCYGSIGYCWCVDKNGDEIPGTRTKFGHVPPLECLLTSNSVKKRTETKCEKLRAEALAKVKEGDMFVLVPECRADGSFNPVQCDQRFSVNFANCWCVDENGDKIPGTEVSVGFGQSKPLKCGENPEK